MGNFAVYRSSAGSGKTFTLVKEYLRLSLCDPNRLNFNFKRILAVTFTNKAAAEMKSRVIEALQELAEKTTISKHGTGLCKEIGINESELQKRAAIVLTQILHHYSDFGIGTIDSFTHKLVRTFAHDLKLPVNFNLEMDVDGFYEKVVAELIDQIGEDPYISKLLKEYVLIKAEENSAWDPEELIINFSRLLRKENSAEFTSVLKKQDAKQLEDVLHQIRKIKNDYYQFLAEKTQKAFDLINKYQLSENDFYYKKNGAFNFFYKVWDKKAGPDEANASRLNEAIESKRWLNNIEDKQIGPQLSAIALEIKEHIIEQAELFSLCKLLDKQIYPLLLLKKIEEISANKKEEERLVFVSEFNNKIFELINNEPTPFIYERLGEKYHHYLLDEFQDTSSLQWFNLIPLLDNSLANGWYNLLVGDGKQSIYRWRNANVKQFADLPNIPNPSGNMVVTERAKNLERNFEELFLQFNYRSLKNIVQFNNQFFDSLAPKLLSKTALPIYFKQAQIAKQQDGGYLSIHTNTVEAEDVVEKNQTLLLSQIESALASGYSYKDICILCRYKKQGSSIAHFLMQENIPVISSESLLLSMNLEVNVVLSFLKYLSNPLDQINAAVVLNYLFQTHSIDQIEFHQALTELAEKKSLFSLLNKIGIQFNPNDFLLDNLLDNCIHIITSLKLSKTGHFYLRFLLDEVNEFLVTENSNIPAFLQWWESRSKKASLIIPSNTNAVKLMTIHASKGLEFPVVIIPYCNWSVFKAQDEWVKINHKELDLPVAVVKLTEQAAKSGLEKELQTEKEEQFLDNLNLLYVAFTRAAERLHIISIGTKRSESGTVKEWIETYAKTQLSSELNGYFEFGQAHPKKLQEQSSEKSQFSLQALEFHQSSQQIEIKAAYLYSNEKAEEAKKHGILLHWLLSQIETTKDQESALQKGKLHGYFQENEIMALRNKLKEVVEAPDLKNYFSSEVNCKVEAELVFSDGEILRPDRIVFFKNETVLMDYKTGKENNKRYAEQLDKYEFALKEMGYPNIKKLLIYVDNLNIVVLN